MVGRDAELAEIEAARSRVAEGGRETVLLAGEPGSGKSRLIAEAAEAAHALGALVLYGSGEATAAESPYAPFVEALGHLERQGTEALREELDRSSLGALAAESGDEAPWDLSDDRAKLFAAALELLERITRHGPLLLAIDDLHSCGPSTVALVRHLARAGRGAPVLLLVAYRPTDVDPGGEVAEAIAELRSEAGSRHLQLGALEPPALRDIASSLNPGADDASLDHAAISVARESGGNALFACELLRAMGDVGVPSPPAPSAPRSLRMLIAARAHALGEPAFACLSAGAAFGRAFAPADLGAATGVGAEAVEGSLRAAERAGLIAAEGDRYAFSHAIVAHCLYEEIEPAARGALHRRFGEQLEAEPDLPAGEGRSAQLAHHWLRAEPGDRERATRYCAEAGEAALRSYDHELAASWFERALEQRGEGSEDIELCDLLIGLGVALRYTNQERSRECLLRAARLADRLDEVDRLVAAALANNRGFVSQVGGFDRERAAMLRRAGERLEGRGAEAALVLAQLALELTFTDQIERRRWLVESALLAARRSGDRRVLAQVLVRCLIARWDPDNATERIAMAAESLEIGAELDEPLDMFQALHWQAVAQLEIGEVEAAARSLREQDRISGRIGDATARWLYECSESLHLSLHGQLEEAETRAQRAVEGARHSGQPDALPPYISQLCSIRWQQGRIGELAPLLGRALHQYPGIPGFRSLVALAHTGAGELAAAREVLSSDVATRFEALPRDPIWFATVVTYAHAVADLGDREAAAILHGILDPYRGRLATTAVAIWGVADHALGRLELLCGEEDAGRRSLHTAIGAYVAMQAPRWKALAERDLEAVGGTESALEARIGALDLTDRQAEVTRLIARGLSNREVAERLQLSPSTVKRHLENVYRRTGVSSRGALTALLLE